MDMWVEALKQTWINGEWLKNKADAVDKALCVNNLLAFNNSKNRSLVPVIIPEDTIGIIQKIIDNRPKFCAPQNNFIFSCRNNSLNFVDGWGAVNQTLRECESSGITFKRPETLTGTANRHRLATKMARVELTTSVSALLESGSSQKC